MEIIKEILAKVPPGERFSLVTVIKTTGSTARKAGAVLACDIRGKLISGTIGGGVVEKDALTRGGTAAEQSRSETFSYEVNGTIEPHKPTPPQQLCGGNQEVFINGRACRYRGELEKGVRLWDQRRPAVLISVVSHRSLEIGSILSCAGDEFHSPDLPVKASLLERLIKERTCRLYSDSDGNTFFLEPVIPGKRIVVIGGGHCGKSVAELAQWFKYSVTVIDQRDVEADDWPQKREVNWICGDYAEEISRCGIDNNTWVVIMTHSHDTDAQALKACLHSSARYIGMIGSKRKIAAMKKLFLDSGFASATEWEKIHTPIGLEIKAETAKEIALSVLAEIIFLENSTRQDQKRESGF